MIQRVCSVRKAQASDLEAMITLLHQLFSIDVEFEPQYENQKRGLQAILENPSLGEILVITYANRVIGMVSMLYSISTVLGVKVAVFEDMIIDEQYRQMGLGSLLFTEALAYAQAQQCKRITLLTDSTNHAAIAMYSKFGFTKSCMIPMRYSIL